MARLIENILISKGNKSILEFSKHPANYFSIQPRIKLACWTFLIQSRFICLPAKTVRVLKLNLANRNFNEKARLYIRWEIKAGQHLLVTSGKWFQHANEIVIVHIHQMALWNYGVWIRNEASKSAWTECGEWMDHNIPPEKQRSMTWRLRCCASCFCLLAMILFNNRFPFLSFLYLISLPEPIFPSHVFIRITSRLGLCFSH